MADTESSEKTFMIVSARRPEIVTGRAVWARKAGLSMSVGLPSWQQFVEHLAEELGLDPATLADTGTSYHALAEYYRIREGSIGPLRSWLDRNWKVSSDRVRGSKIHELIVALTRILLLQPIFLGAGGMVIGILTAYQRFFAQALAPLFYNGAIIVAAAVFAPLYGVTALAVGVVCGAILHVGVQLPSLWRTGWRPTTALGVSDPVTASLIGC